MWRALPYLESLRAAAHRRQTAVAIPRCDFLRLAPVAISAVARRANTRLPIETNPGQHLALALAAHLARTELVPDPLAGHDTRQIVDILNCVGWALARVAPLYVHEAQGAEPRELMPAELEGAAVLQSATVVLLKDGRKLSRVTIKRADLRQAVAILKSIGVGQIAGRPKSPPAPPAIAASDTLAGRVTELEALLQPPYAAGPLETANRLVMSIARDAADGRIANRAMQLISALHDSRSDVPLPGGVPLALARLRLALEETRQTHVQQR